MPDIDPRKIKPGDTVRMRVQSYGMQRNEIDPIEFTSKAYRIGESVHVGAYRAEDSSQVTILEHIPARPDWADALVVRDREPRLWAKVKDRYAIVAGGSAGGSTATAEDIDQMAGPITVIIDADGNPPQPEPEWLDADALDKLPDSSIILPKVGPPRVRHFGDWFNIPGGIGVRSEHLDPACLLWTPEADR